MGFPRTDAQSESTVNPLDGRAANSFYVMDMVHNNPGEPSTKTAFANPGYLKKMGYNSVVINDFVFATSAVTFDSLHKNIFPKKSKERAWVMQAEQHIQKNIAAAHKAGLKIYYFTDMVLLPKRLVEIYKDQICDEKGKISFDRPMTRRIHEVLFDELFKKFPNLDGLVIRTGETYLNNVPYHTGNNPITHGVASHIQLIRFLRKEVCEKYHKMIFYRTWAAAKMDQSLSVYDSVTSQIKPSPYLIFMIKHTKGDYQRTFDFNPTIGKGNQDQIIEVECQREYEGKGAFPDYIAQGVIEGFEEFKTNTPQKGYSCLEDIKNNPLFKGVWTWSRGGGWVGPYITNEFWPKLNAYVISQWALHRDRSESQIFSEFMQINGIKGNSAKAFRELCILSAKAVLRGHSSATLHWPAKWVWWTRDEFLSGTDGFLGPVFKSLYDQNLLQSAVKEKMEAVTIWEKITKLSKQITMPDKKDEAYIRISCKYGYLLHQIIAQGWKIMALGYTGDITGHYDKKSLEEAIRHYDKAWINYKQLKIEYPACATLYKPYEFIFKAPDYHGTKGMGASVDKYRTLLNNN